MGEADRDSTAAYNYPRFDEYVAAGGDMADEDAFRASPWAGQPAPDFTLPTARGVAVRYAGVIRDAVGGEGGRLQDGCGIAGASAFGPCRFLGQERAVGDMMAARRTRGGGPA